MGSVIRRHVSEDDRVLKYQFLEKMIGAITKDRKETGFLRHSPDSAPFTPAYAGCAGII
jgi:hypothetical protein